MGHYVHLHVAFHCTDNAPLAMLAKNCRKLINNEDCLEAIWFLNDLSERTGKNLGPKGGLCLWGIVGNGTYEMEFARLLEPFWKGVLEGGDDGIACDHEHILIFYEHEQKEACGAIEIFWDDEQSPDRKLVFNDHQKLPFTFMQF